MKLDQQEKQILKVLLIAITFYFAVLRIDKVANVISYFYDIINPFIFGGMIAFVINVPMSKIEKLLEKAKVKKFKRIFAFLITIVLFLLFIEAVFLIVVPQLSRTILSLIDRLREIYNALPTIFESRSGSVNFLGEILSKIEIDWPTMAQKALNTAKDFLTGLLGNGSAFIGGFVGKFTNGVMSVIFSIYILMGKEKIGSALKSLGSAVLPDKAFNKILYILSLSNKIFSNFLSGQCTEAVILGTLFVIAMLICNMPYAVLIGVVIAITALIPVFGAFIGCGVGILLIALENPMQAVWFTILFLLLQQFENNLIYPHVVGSSVGLPSILVFMSVIIGGSLMGMGGMLLFIPGTSVLYTLVKEYVTAKQPVTADTEIVPEDTAIQSTK